ncbi:MAG: peroxiredoxin-like family protein [Bacteroidota bacterium]
MRILSFLLFLAVSLHGAAQSGTAEEICPILIGAQAPDATLRNIEGEHVQFHAAIEGKKTLLVVYRGGWCPYCTRHLAALAKIEDEVKELGFQIVAITPDRPEELTKTMDKKSLTFTLLSDSKMALSDALGVSFKVDDATIERYKKWDIDLVRSSGETHERLPVPAVILLNDAGMVTYTYVNPNYKVRADGDLILAACRAVE